MTALILASSLLMNILLALMLFLRRTDPSRVENSVISKSQHTQAMSPNDAMHFCVETLASQGYPHGMIIAGDVINDADGDVNCPFTMHYFNGDNVETMLVLIAATKAACEQAYGEQCEIVVMNGSEEVKLKTK